MKRVLRKTKEGMLSRVFQLLSYADYIDINGHTKRHFTPAFSAIGSESAYMGLAVNGKNKYVLSTSGDMPRIGYQITVVK